MNDPAPLFTKIEPARVEELKKLFAGKQSENGKSKEGDGDVEALRAAVAKQVSKKICKFWTELVMFSSSFETCLIISG